MELRLERLWPKETYTVGRLYIDNKFFCNTLEDKVTLVSYRNLYCGQSIYRK